MEANTKSKYLSDLHYFFAQTNGTYNYLPGSIGDLLKQAKKEIEELTNNKPYDKQS